MGTYLEHLLNTKGYTCIRYFICTNEPNGEVGDWARWKQGLLNLHGEVKKRGLADRITLVGSDTSQSPDNEPWHRLTVDELQDVIGVYDIHRYETPEVVKAGSLEDYMRGHRNYALAKDSADGKKHHLIGEAGMWAFNSDYTRCSTINDYEYGVFMADYAVQAARAGWTGVSAWMLSDNSHKDFQWGMWRSQEKGMELRPWFYAWSLLTRFVRPGAAIYRLEDPDGVRMMAAAKDGQWTLVCVNRSGVGQNLTVELPEDWHRKTHTYLYQDGPRKLSPQGFPQAERTENYDSGEDVSVGCPNEAVLLITTLE
jgi:hypothetical protein